MPPVRITRAGVIGTLVALVVAAVCARLGVWQLDRLDQRTWRNERIAARMALPSIALNAVAEDTAELSYRRAELRGEYDHARSIVLAGRGHRGSPGVHLLTPLHLAGGRGAVLVNRGWLPSPDAATVDLSGLQAPGVIDVVGLVVPLPSAAPSDRSDAGARGEEVIAVPDAGPARDGFRRVWYRIDADALRRQFPYPVAPYTVRALPDDEAAALPTGRPATFPIRLPPPELDDGPHLSYAIQWFSFAAIALIGWGVLALRRGELAGGARGPAGPGRARRADRPRPTPSSEPAAGDDAHQTE